MKKGFGLLALGALMCSGQTFAAVKTETVEYKHGDKVLAGTLSYDDAIPGKRPGVLVVHEWWGINPYVRKRAEQLARLGYIAFALDMYGKGVTAKDAKEAGSMAGALKSDRPLMRSRAQAGLDVLKNNRLTDQTRMAAMGYCFGGTTALELARGGADLLGTVCFHGSLNTPNSEDAKNIKGKILALQGGDDPYVPAAEVSAFEEEMRKAGVDWQLVQYGGAVHSFTNPDSGNDNSKGAAYNQKADLRSWEAMKAFFQEIFK